MKLLFTLVLSLFYTFAQAANKPVTTTKSVAAADNDDDDKFPTPADNISRLFYVQRDPNTNTIIYELNDDKNGKIVDEANPLHVYWIRYSEKGQKEELSYIQRKFAYGLTTKKLPNDQWDVRFVSYKKFPLLLTKGSNGKYHILANIDQKQIILNRIFVKIVGGSFWLPNVVYVELKGTDQTTGKEITHRFKP